VPLPRLLCEHSAFLVGDRYSIAHIALHAYTHVADEGGLDLGIFPSIDAWMEWVAAQPRTLTHNLGLDRPVMEARLARVEHLLWTGVSPRAC
jgi:glutathione S-transferase